MLKGEEVGYFASKYCDSVNKELVIGIFARVLVKRSWFIYLQTLIGMSRFIRLKAGCRHLLWLISLTLNPTHIACTVKGFKQILQEAYIYVTQNMTMQDFIYYVA